MKRPVLAGLLALVPAMAGAELKSSAADAMLIELHYTIAAPAARVWDSLIYPERWAGGSVEHGRVIMAKPGKMRLSATLGPLQEMAVAGVTPSRSTKRTARRPWS